MRAQSLKLSFAFNLAGMAVPIAVALVTIPLYLQTMGESRYGVLAIAWLLLGYAGFLDLGLSRATANALARLAEAPLIERGRLIVSALYLNSLLGIAGGGVIAVLGGMVFQWWFDLPPDLAAEAAAALPWLGAMLPMALLSGIAIGALESKERFLAANVLQVTGSTLGQVVPVIIAMHVGPGLDLVIPAAFAMRLVSLVLILGVLAHSERIRPYRFDPKVGRSLFQYGAWVSVTGVVGPILTSVDQVIIGAKLGTAAVAHYAVPMNLTVKAQGVAAALARTMFPRFSRYDSAAAIDLAERSTVTLAYGFGAICGSAMILAGPFLEVWINPEFAAQATPVAHILILGAWINGLAFLALFLVQGQGRPDLAARIHLAELLPFLALLWLLVQAYGLEGAAVAWTLRVGIDALVFFWVSGQRSRRMLRLLPAAGLLL
ncbi:MAG: hypothetical protein RLY86_3068, partial [Pseudomonadota bacterium]